MKTFSELGIKTALQPGLIGDKIKMDRILNRIITVCDFRVKESKFKGKCLYLQINVDGVNRVIFTGATALIDTILRIPTKDFPFSTTIVKENERYEFT